MDKEKREPLPKSFGSAECIVTRGIEPMNNHLHMLSDGSQNRVVPFLVSRWLRVRLVLPNDALDIQQVQNQ